MGLEFTQEEVEKALSDKLPHGSCRDIATKSGLGESYIKRQFNPDDETASCVFRTLQVVCAFDEIDADQGEEFWKQIVFFREASRRQKANAQAAADLNLEIGQLGVEVSEFISSKLIGLPIDDQLKELLDIELKLPQIKSELLRQKTEANLDRNKQGIGER